MIVIKTANGNRFINEAEIKSISHLKERAMVIIDYKNSSSNVVYLVEEMYYTNKSETEVHDYGLMLKAATTDKEYWKEMCKSAEKYVKWLCERRNELECFIINVAEHPDSSPEYRANFIERMRDEIRKRPDTWDDELREHRKHPFYQKVREDSDFKGAETENKFIRMAQEIEKQQRWSERYREANERLMNRGLWARIMNKKTYL